MEEIIKRQIAIFREVSNDMTTKLEEAIGIKWYDLISNLMFNGSHNGMPGVPGKVKAVNSGHTTAEYPTTDGAPVSVV